MSGAMCAAAGSGAGAFNPIPVTFLFDTHIGGSSTCGIQFETNGVLTLTGSGGSAGATWYAFPMTGIGSFYWVRATVTAGSAPTTGTTGTWQQINAARGWTWQKVGVGSKTATLTLELAVDAAGADIVASTTGISVTAEVD